jgi:hypothetical protein
MAIPHRPPLGRLARRSSAGRHAPPLNFRRGPPQPNYRQCAVRPYSSSTSGPGLMRPVLVYRGATPLRREAATAGESRTGTVRSGGPPTAASCRRVPRRVLSPTGVGGLPGGTGAERSAPPPFLGPGSPWNFHHLQRRAIARLVISTVIVGSNPRPTWVESGWGRVAPTDRLPPRGHLALGRVLKPHFVVPPSWPEPRNAKAIVKVHGVFPSSHGYGASSPRIQLRWSSTGDSRTVVQPFARTSIKGQWTSLP